MTDLEAIGVRRSRRTYTGPLPREAVAKLTLAAKHLSKEEDLHIEVIKDAPTIFGGFSKNYGLFKGVRSFIVLGGPENDPHLKEKVGRAGEALVLELTKMGFGSCWIMGTYNRSGVARLLKSGEALVAVISAGPSPEKWDMRENLVAGFSHRGVSPTPDNYTTDTDPPYWFLQGVEAAYKAPSAMNRKPVFFTYRDGDAYAAIPETGGSQKVDLGIAKLHFEIAAKGRFEPGNDAVFTRDTNVADHDEEHL